MVSSSQNGSTVTLIMIQNGFYLCFDDATFDLQTYSTAGLEQRKKIE